jgi:hypothetical protein
MLGCAERFASYFLYDLVHLEESQYFFAGACHLLHLVFQDLTTCYELGHPVVTELNWNLKESS